MFRCTRFSDDLYTAFPIFTEKTQDLLLKAIHRSLSYAYNHWLRSEPRPYVNENRFLMQGEKASPGRPVVRPRVKKGAETAAKSTENGVGGEILPCFTGSKCHDEPLH